MNLRSISALQFAMAASLAAHAAILTVRFVDPERFRRVFEDSPLEVILVNARTNDAPEKAQAIAQANLAGGGDAERGRATTPLPPSMQAEPGDAQDDQTLRALRSMQEQQMMLLAQVRRQVATLPLHDPRRASLTPEQAALEERRRQLSKSLAEIERRIQLENARPKKRYISPATREKAYAIYYDSLRRSIEDKGTENFPMAGGRKLYGELTMIVTVNFDGRVLATEVVDSSGNAVLDRRAEMIARSAGPFGLFTEAMRREAEQIVVVSRFKFTRDETLEAQVTGK